MTEVEGLRKTLNFTPIEAFLVHKNSSTKQGEPLPLDAGVLVIGSLFWDSENGRQAWREARLDMASAQIVTAPIRYARRSRTRGNSYTMVYSRLCPVGQAKLVPCSRKISNLKELIAEAEYLWSAEQHNAKQHRIASAWGCVAMLFNPKRNIPQELLKGWAECVSRDPNYGRVSQTHEEGALVNREGLLRIDWPLLVESGVPADFDVLMTTATDPGITASSPAYPTVQAIADAWNESGPHVEYFWRNSDNGIRTFQDDDIRTLLHPRNQVPR